MIIHDHTITAAGEQYSRRTHESTTLEPAAVRIFRDLVRGRGWQFRSRLPVPINGLAPIEVQLTCESPSEGAALATFWIGTLPILNCAIVSGRDHAKDRECLRQIQSLAVMLYRHTGVEPAFDAVRITDRPLLVCMPFPLRGYLAHDGERLPGVYYMEERVLVADASTCLAAAVLDEWAAAEKKGGES